MKRTDEFISFAVTDQVALSLARLIADSGLVSWIPAPVEIGHEILSMVTLSRRPIVGYKQNYVLSTYCPGKAWLG